MDYHSVVLDIRKMKRQDNVTVGITFSESHCNVLKYKCILSVQGKMIIVYRYLLLNNLFVTGISTCIVCTFL